MPATFSASGRGSACSLRRYSVTVALGAAIDLGVAITLANLLGVPLHVAAVVGFVVALSFNYLMFEFWAFGRQDARISSMRLAGTVLSAVIAIGIRLATITILGIIMTRTPLQDTLRLMIAMGCSLVVNYLLLRDVFRPSRTL